jgi:hypothetical protein
MSPPEIIEAAGVALAVLAFWGRIEHRLTKIETLLGKLPCDDCPPKKHHL